MKKEDVEIIERIACYEGHARLYRYRLRHRKYDGGTTDEMSREVLERAPAVCVLPYDPVRDEVVLVEQFRIGAYAAGLPPWQTEIVAGLVEEGETPEDVARRETEEESGCVAGELHYVALCLSSSGIMSEAQTVYCAIVDTSAAGGTYGLDHEHEDIRATVYALDDALALIGAGKILHPPGIVALQWLAANRNTLRGAD